MSALVFGLIIAILHALFGTNGVTGRRATRITFGGVDLEDAMQNLLIRSRVDGARMPSRAQVETTLRSRWARRERLHESMKGAAVSVPSHEGRLSARELLELASQHLEPRVLEQFVLKAEGKTFQEIGEASGETGDAVRKRLARESVRMRGLLSP